MTRKPQWREPVLLTDGDERATLAAARSLVSAGFEVHVASRSRLSLAGVSRQVRAHACAHDPLRDPCGYVTDLAKLSGALGIRVLLPVTDQSVMATLQHRQLLPQRTLVPFPGLDAFQTASDKLRVLQLATQAGLEAPETVIVHDPADPSAVPSAFFPAVVKPHRSLVATPTGWRKVSVTPVASRDECVRALHRLPEAAYPVLVQRQVEGPGEGLFVLRWCGRLVALFAHRRLREKPPTGGVSVYRESISPPEGLAAAGVRLVELLDWNGVAMVECKRNLATGRHAIVEVNARLWGSLQLAIDAGVDFPRLWVQCALGDNPPPVTDYRTGIRSRWFWGDVDHLYLRLRKASIYRPFESAARSRLRALADFLTYHPGRDYAEVWRWRDPAPYLLETLRRLTPWA